MVQSKSFQMCKTQILLLSIASLSSLTELELFGQQFQCLKYILKITAVVVTERAVLQGVGNLT